MYDKNLESELFGGRRNMEAHNKRQKAAAIERLKRNAAWNKANKGRKPQQQSEE